MIKPSEIDFNKIGFSYMKTPYNIRCHYSNGEWGEIQVSDDEYYPIHISSTALHYGQQAFEGLKAIRGVDGKVRIFRLEENAKRMQRSAEMLMMAAPPVDLFCEAVIKVVEKNIDYVPSCTTNGSLYIRPVLFGVGPVIGVSPAQEYMLIVFVTPVGGYFVNGKVGVTMMLDRHHDRAGHYGTGSVKAGGNYASSLKSGVEAHKKGYDGVIYLDPLEHKYIDECGAANFYGIKGNKYVTPHSNSILPSITNKSLMQIAEDYLGLEVERRDIDFQEEIAGFEECGAIGTAAVIAPIELVYDPDNDKTYNFVPNGKHTKELVKIYYGIKNGEIEDKYNWNTIVGE